MTSHAQISSEDYMVVREFLEAHAGIRLGDGKEYLVTSRLGRVINEFGLEGFPGLAQMLKRAANPRLLVTVVDAMTTNETFWFRDAAHYRALTDDVLKHVEGSRVRIWSAAASTGQEAFSITMSIRDAMTAGTLSRTLGYEVLGTDISPTALAQANAARYCGVSAARGLTDQQRRKYFHSDGQCIEVLPEYRSSVTFREFNLTKPFDLLGKFDVIFCRNVLIYFSQERKRDIIERFARSLNPQGVLFIGSTESMSDHGDLFEMQSFGGGLVYRKR